ncbi:MAG TPA: hypothetical protein VJ484_03730 [Lysobacter sp.]|nr:hypothetical protein [Lysobacter sp.]
MHSDLAHPTRMTRAALCGRMSVAGPALIQHVNNNRNNASLPRAGD